MTTLNRLSIVALTALAAGCAPKRVHQEPIIENDERVARTDISGTAARASEQQVLHQVSRDSIVAEAMATCRGDVCAAITRGELALGMNTDQILAATRTTYDAWTVRRSGNAAILVPRTLQHAPTDAVGEVAMVQVTNGLVRSYSYNEAQGMRVVSNPEDATTAGRAAAMADMLVREGDDYVARGEFDMALDRYDRAHVLSPNDPEVTYRIATTLDKKLRPIEALIQYRLFLHQLEIERIGAIGEAYGHLANAIAHARERIIVLERR